MLRNLIYKLQTEDRLAELQLDAYSVTQHGRQWEF